MRRSGPARTVDYGTGTRVEPARVTRPTSGLAVYGCGQDEAVMFQQLAPRFGISVTTTDAAVSEDNADLAAGNMCISIGHKVPVPNNALLALSRTGVEYISTRSIGYNHIDTEFAAKLGICVGNVAYSPDSVADFTLMLMLMAVRQAKSLIRRGDAHDYRLSDTRGKELRDLTVGIVGTGRIGSAVIDRLRGFGSNILAHDKHRSAGVAYVPLDELLRRSDVVTLHTPLGGETHHLLNPARIEQMKDGAYLINTARGALIDTEALVSALERGHLGGAALDVIEGEEGIFYNDCRGTPLTNAWLTRLQQLPNVHISPHTAYYTEHALADTVENSLINCLDFENRNRRA